MTQKGTPNFPHEYGGRGAEVSKTLFYIADTILMMKDGRFILQEPMATVTDGIEGKVWELFEDERTRRGIQPPLCGCQSSSPKTIILCACGS